MDDEELGLDTFTGLDDGGRLVTIIKDAIGKANRMQVDEAPFSAQYRASASRRPRRSGSALETNGAFKGDPGGTARNLSSANSMQQRKIRIGQIFCYGTDTEGCHLTCLRAKLYPHLGRTRDVRDPRGLGPVAPPQYPDTPFFVTK